MKVELLRKHINAFAGFMKTHDPHEHLYKYAMLANFRTHWDANRDNLTTIYDAALQSDVTRRWWSRTNYRPKEMMLELIGMHPDYVRQAFRDLFDETKSIDRRLDRFQYYCDELLRMYKARNRDTVVNSHHQDPSMISFYLAAMYPGVYSLYPGLDLFNRYLLTLEGKPSQIDDLERFFKIMRNTYRFLMQDQEMSQILVNSVRPPGHLLVAHEFLYFVCGCWEEHTP